MARYLGVGFLDCDLLVQNEQKAPLAEIIEREGAEGYIRIEDNVCANLWAKKCVIATGGSVVYGERAMARLKELGKVVYLRIGEQEVERRIRNFATRGVVMCGQVKTLKELYEQRTPLYEKYADIILDCDGLSFNETVKKLSKIARENGLKR